MSKGFYGCDPAFNYDKALDKLSKGKIMFIYRFSVEIIREIAYYKEQERDYYVGKEDLSKLRTQDETAVYRTETL